MDKPSTSSKEPHHSGVHGQGNGAIIKRCPPVYVPPPKKPRTLPQMFPPDIITQLNNENDNLHRENEGMKKTIVHLRNRIQELQNPGKTCLRSDEEVPMGKDEQIRGLEDSVKVLGNKLREEKTIVTNLQHKNRNLMDLLAKRPTTRRILDPVTSPQLLDDILRAMERSNGQEEAVESPVVQQQQQANPADEDEIIVSHSKDQRNAEVEKQLKQKGADALWLEHEREFKKIIEKLKEKASGLKKKLGEKDKRVKELEEQLQLKDQEVRREQGTLDQKKADERVRDLEAEVKDLKEELEARDQQLQESQEMIELKDQKIAELEEEMMLKIGEFNVEQEDEIQTFEKANDDFQEITTAEKEAAQQRIQEWEEEVQDLEVQDSEAEANDLKRELELKDQRIAELEEKIKQIHLERVDKNQKATSIEKGADQRRIQGLEREAEDFEKRLKSKDQRIQELEEKLRDDEVRRVELEQTANDLKEKLKTNDQKLEKSQETIESKDQKIAELEEEMKLKIKQFQEQEKKNKKTDTANIEKAAAQQRLENLEVEVEGSEKTLKSKDHRIQELEEELVVANQRIHGMESRMTSLRMEILRDGAKDRMIERLQEQIKAMQVLEAREARMAAKDSEDRIHELEVKLEKAELEISEQCLEIGGLKGKVEFFEKRVGKS